MTVLGIETSTKTCAVALVHDGDLVAEYRHKQARIHAEILAGLVDKLMVTSGVNWSELQGIGVSSGPGSYTGLRIGMSLAKGLAFAHSLPIAGIPTTSAIARSLIGLYDRFTVVLPSRKGEIYVAAYKSEADELRTIENAQALLLTDFSSWAGGVAYVAGPGVSALQAAHIDGIKVIPEQFWQIGALNVAAIAAEKFAEGKADDLDSLEPNYVKPFYTTAKI
ncbi:MAG: tRNA (adenosine(37)-N6)-threonylcarbamoyltransferase complex dimerization subunit type 1 TsaB [Calditrichaeota bacterium]|nr:MAG: tRNA (adenosine(37)-N6)-threonylcarbamoyltransferase complex dimerization subunit type 1 TsaB [Calditrichota bacterium]